MFWLRKEKIEPDTLLSRGWHIVTVLWLTLSLDDTREIIPDTDEPEHEKNNLFQTEDSEDSDQAEQPPSVLSPV